MSSPLISLSKFLAQSGICSRRKAVEFIRASLVTVDGEVITEPGYKVTGNEKIVCANQSALNQRKRYILLNKPKDCITTLYDEKGRRTVIDVIGPKIKERIYPVGRLDRETTGLLLLTNDGDLAQHLAHPRYEVEKIYYVVLDKLLRSKDERDIKKGLVLEDGPAEIDELTMVPRSERREWFLRIHSGRNRIIRRIFKHCGYEVVALDRVGYAGLEKGNLPVGRWRFLDEDEIEALKER